jgi:hypothetical protein
MAHFAKLDINGKVLGVHSLNNKNCQNADGKEDEKVGQQFLESIHGWPGSMWVQTSYNTKMGKHYTNGVESEDQSKALRGNYAGVGQIYDKDNDIFILKQPYTNWTLNTTTATWDSPTPRPITTTGERADHYNWNESTQAWDKVVA